MVSHYAQSVPGKPEAPYRISSSKASETTASIELAWYPLLETGGVPLTGFKLYSVNEDDKKVVEFDGSDHPEILTFSVGGLKLNKQY